MLNPADEKTLQNNSVTTGKTRGKLSRWKFAAYALLSVGAIVLVSALVILFHPDPFINAFLKARITEALREAYPAYSIRIATIHCKVWENRVGCDSLVVEATDSSLKCSVGAFSIRGMGWLQLLRGDGLAPTSVAGSVVAAESIVLLFPVSQYELRCGQLRISIPDSEMIADALELHPAVDDRQFFAGSKFRKTRFSLTTQRCSVTGVDVLGGLDRKNYRARCVHIYDMCLDILVNKDKASIRDSSTSPMPNEILSSMKDTIQCDSMEVINGALKYGERITAGAKPAVITFDSIQVLAKGIANHGDRGAPIVIHTQGIFMRAGTMHMLMSIPVASPEFSFQYSGSLSRMDLRALNGFIETAEHMRIKSGLLQSATFEINVASGRASGHVRAVYRDLILAAINGRTGSEKGFVDGISSFIANTFKIRKTNVPDASGSVKLGKVKYIRQRDDPFFRFVWFALRSGVGDVAGF